MCRVQWDRPLPLQQYTHEHTDARARHFFCADRMPERCTAMRAFLGRSEATGDDPRRSGTALGQARTPAATGAPSSPVGQRGAGKRETCDGGAPCATRGSDGARRGTVRWQRDGRGGRAAVRSDRVGPEIWACKGSGRVPCLHEEIEGGNGESGHGESGGWQEWRRQRRRERRLRA